MNTLKRNQLIMLAMPLSLALPLVALAQNPGSPEPRTNEQTQASPATGQSAGREGDATKVSRTDADFLKEAALGGMLEVELGRLAMRNAGSDEVRRLGQQMIDDHSKSNQELKSLAQSEGVMLPSQLDPQHGKALQRMQKLSGADFDREYMKMMLEDHRKDIKAFNDEGHGGDDPEVKLFAMRTLATLRAHLATVESTLKIVDANAGRKPESAARPQPAAGQPEKGQQ
jgi:putative membrane protein